ncbi:T9SS type A sorting domain-containing protein [uncultured Psychroserpens sp.]|uniref:T9SS type A sorting domain-containing protein n=1 Tax=uncultured Psychroserpens sp. TaxID=255436 RepID=UPI002603F5EE|nr:T9SS type A sorting domain-containing protein [uncultured Psychroserpens sp.]
MKTKLLSLAFIVSAFMFNTNTNAQTTLAPGDIAVFWNQADTPDSFAFVTFVDIVAGTGIYFTDCGTTTLADGFRMPACTEGAVKYTAPSGGLSAGDIIQYVDGAAGPDFAPYSDSRITGSLGLATSGDQVVVFQDATSAAGGTNAGNTPTYLFVIHNASTLFTGDPSDSNETSLPFGLTDTGLPRTALGVGAGPGVDVEFDNTVYTGSYTFTTIEDAKIALTDPANYYGSNPNPPGLDATYDAAVAAIPAALTITTLSTNELGLNASVTLFPNPSNGLITIKSEGVALESMQVADINGRIVSTIDLEGATQDKEINLTNALTSGLYLVTIRSNDASITKKLIIQ